LGILTTKLRQFRSDWKMYMNDKQVRFCNVVIRNNAPTFSIVTDQTKPR